MSDKVKLVVGCPVWDRAWALDHWFDSLRANCDPAETGLVFVVPPTDTASRDKINKNKDGFAFCEIVPDRNPQYDRQLRQNDKHESLARARNTLLKHVAAVAPEFYLSWDSDLFAPPGTVQAMMAENKPIMTLWTWLNRAAPRKVRHLPDPEVPEWIDCVWEPPMCATAMKWDGVCRAHHLDSRRWDQYASGVWKADVVLAFKLMKREVYATTQYAPNVWGEDLPFNWSLHQRGIERWVWGHDIGLHLSLDKDQARLEVAHPYPAIMDLANRVPLGSLWYGQQRPPELVAMGYYPTK